MSSIIMFSKAGVKKINMVGGKGANLGEMLKIGIPVPQGFTVTTKSCLNYFKQGNKISESLDRSINQSIKKLENITGTKFDGKSNILLLSVRSGARVSMPGMMDTILNIGINDENVKILASKYSKKVAYDSYRRLIQMYGNVVAGIQAEKFEKEISKVRKKANVKNDSMLSDKDLKGLTESFKKIFKEYTGADFPQDPFIQLKNSIKSVFDSWQNPRAKYYRKINNIPDDWGTAVNVQQMVFGNKNKKSGTGVVFTRNPSNGENAIYGEYLMSAQGEDIVAGVRTPKNIDQLKVEWPEIYTELHKYIKKLEVYYKDMQDIEFTIDDGKLYILQTRNGKRTASAAVKIAVEMQAEGILNKKQAILNIDPNQIEALLHPKFSDSTINESKSIAKGLPASPGAAVGYLAFTNDDVVSFNKENKPSILIRAETSPEDIEGMNLCEGILTSTGGMTSHAAVVARGMGKPCIVGASSIKIDSSVKKIKIGEKTYSSGSKMSLDGSSGKIYLGELDKVDATQSKHLGTLVEWANSYKRLGVRANAETPEDIAKSVANGAEGIGLARTEHMFFEKDRVLEFRKFILSKDDTTRKSALNYIRKVQTDDFAKMFEKSEGVPITVRLIDPPLHEFLPKESSEIKAIANAMGITQKEVNSRIASLKEFNPMLGHRGVRLLITHPEIITAQVNAILDAIKISSKNTVFEPIVEIMIPLVSDYNEVKYVSNKIKEIINQSDFKDKIKVGAMIETPRAAILSGEISKISNFFSFGTNDLTQMTFGFSRDDSAKFIESYRKLGILDSDPFVTIDKKGVGSLVAQSVKAAKKGNRKIKTGICGEHAGDFKTIEFCDKLRLNYVSCSPYRVPAAIIVSAQSKLKK